MENMVNHGLDLVNYLRKENDPLYKDGELCLYSDSKSTDYSDEIVNDFADILIKENGLGSLEEIADRMTKLKTTTLYLEVNSHLSISFESIRQYIHPYFDYDEYTDSKIMLNDFEKQCDKLHNELVVLFKRIRDVIYQKTGYYCLTDYISISTKWFVSLSKYSTTVFNLEMSQKILPNLIDTNAYVVKIENEKGELFLPSYEEIAVDFDFIAPLRAINVYDGKNAVGYSFRKTGVEHAQLFRNLSAIISYLRSLEYTGRVVVIKQNINELIHLDGVTANSIATKYVEEANSNNTIYDGVYSDETKNDLVLKVCDSYMYNDIPMPSTYININALFNIAPDTIYKKDEIFEAVKQIAKSHIGKNSKYNDGEYDFKGTRLVDFKGELITVSDLLDRISEEEFLSLLNTYTGNYSEHINISREWLNNNNIVYYNNDRLYGRQFNRFFEDNVREDKLVLLSPSEREIYIKNHPTVYAIRMVRKNRNIIRVEVDDNGNRIAGFKKCDLIIFSKESLGEYLHDTRNYGIGGCYESNVNYYGVSINLTVYNGEAGVYEPYDIYRHKETGQIFIARKNHDFHYPIPLNFKFD